MENINDFLVDFVKEYRNTDSYKRLYNLMILGCDDWRVFFEERVRKTHGDLPKEEALFWVAFLFDPMENDVPFAKDWLGWLSEGHGTAGQQTLAKRSLEAIEQYTQNIHPKSQQDNLPNELYSEDDSNYFAVAKKKGRPSKPFNSVLVGDEETKEATLKTLHNLIKDKANSKAVIYIKTAIIMGLIQKPTYPQFTKEFGQIASRTIYNKYVMQNLFSDDEIRGAKQALTNAQ